MEVFGQLDDEDLERLQLFADDAGDALEPGRLSRAIPPFPENDPVSVCPGNQSHEERRKDSLGPDAIGELGIPLRVAGLPWLLWIGLELVESDLVSRAGEKRLGPLAKPFADASSDHRGALRRGPARLS